MTDYTREQILAACARHTAPMHVNRAPLLAPVCSEAELARLEDILDHEPLTDSEASLLWVRIAGMAAVLDYGGGDAR